MQAPRHSLSVSNVKTDQVMEILQWHTHFSIDTRGGNLPINFTCGRISINKLSPQPLSSLQTQDTGPSLPPACASSGLSIARSFGLVLEWHYLSNNIDPFLFINRGWEACVCLFLCHSQSHLGGLATFWPIWKTVRGISHFFPEVGFSD